LSLKWFYAFFVVSGFCGLTYEVVWLRLAMAQFGVNTPVVAIVLSVFMGGIALGSVLGGRLSRRLDHRSERIALRLYALSELLIGLSSVAVPLVFEFGRGLLNGVGRGAVWGSGSYYLMSALWITVTLLPFTACMGATIPLAMWAIRRSVGAEQKAFSYLYASNVLGATAGTVASAFLLVEFIGFRNTMLLAGILNVIVAVVALAFSFRGTRPLPIPSAAGEHKTLFDDGGSGAPVAGRSYTMFLLFMTGLMSLGMEVVWTRQFTPYLGTVVYAFSGTLALYLAATFLGSTVYRWWIAARHDRDLGLAVRWALIGVGITGVFPIILSDPRMPFPLERLWGPVRIFLGVVPFCSVVGFLSPLLVDRWSRGDPKRAGNAYAINTLGCILGPLLASFAFLPALSERWAILAFLAPTVMLGLTWHSSFDVRRAYHRSRSASALLPVALGAVLLLLVWASQDPENLFAERVVKRDYSATVVAATVGGEKHLFVNGQGMVYLTPVTKMMAHLPLAFRERPAQDGLVVCFGMGTSLRSMHSWGTSITGVELVPSVPSLFGYFHKDGPEILKSSQVHVEIDDGRRFLERTLAQYDVITVDPPPPVETAGSSLLYSVEWYALIKKRLRRDGILQEWLPYGDLATLTAVTRALNESFPYVRVFNSFEGWGFHFLASMSPIERVPASVLAERLPPAAVIDLVELGPHPTAQQQFQAVLERELSVDTLLAASPQAPALTDDFPVNEYFLWRRLLRNDWSIYFSYSAGAFVSKRLVASTASVP
jgi:spermidine synthase